MGRMTAAGKAEEFIMANTDKTAMEIEWDLDTPVREDQKECGVQCHMSGLNQFHIMMTLLNEGAITFENLEEFRDDLRITIKHFAGQCL